MAAGCIDLGHLFSFVIIVLVIIALLCATLTLPLHWKARKKTGLLDQFTEQQTAIQCVT